MVLNGFSTCRIRSYLRRWVFWWLRTADSWKYAELLNWLIQSCYENNPAAFIAAGLLEQRTNLASNSYSLAMIDKSESSLK